MCATIFSLVKHRVNFQIQKKKKKPVTTGKSQSKPLNASKREELSQHPVSNSHPSSLSSFTAKFAIVVPDKREGQ